MIPIVTEKLTYIYLSTVYRKYFEYYFSDDVDEEELMEEGRGVSDFIEIH